MGTNSVFAQSDDTNETRKVLDVSYVVTHLDSLYGERITVNGTYAWKYPFPVPTNDCGEFPVSELPKSANYDSTYAAFRRGAHYLFEYSTAFNGPVLELRSVNGSYAPLPIPTPFYGDPFTVTGTLEKQYVQYECGPNGPVFFKSAYLSVGMKSAKSLNKVSGIDLQNSTKSNTTSSKSLPTHDERSSSPLKQFKSGIAAKDVKCKESFVLIIQTNGDPACVKPISVPRLLSHGWITLEKFEAIHPVLPQNKPNSSQSD